MTILERILPDVRRELDEARAYWMRQLRGASATPVPADHALPTGTRPGERSDITSLLLPGELSAAFESFARKHDATLFESLFFDLSG